MADGAAYLVDHLVTTVPGNWLTIFATLVRAAVASSLESVVAAG